MNFDRLEKNLTDNIYEAQLKLGYDKRPIRLNYTAASICNLLEEHPADNDLSTALEQFSQFAAPRFGTITFSPIKDGFCFIVPAEGTAFVHDNAPETSFIADLIELVRRHGITIDDVLSLFRRYSANICTEDMSSSGEFDLLVYFEDSLPDDYRYCFSVDDDFGCCHISYHRFIPEDYAELGF